MIDLASYLVQKERLHLQILKRKKQKKYLRNSIEIIKRKS